MLLLITASDRFNSPEETRVRKERNPISHGLERLG